MRPLRLKIKGLNSFTKEQTIDFEALSACGIFGIFGPTGSGKSTILDGITLALYGDLARKSSNFIHSSEAVREAGIQFTFQISGKTPRVYQVERYYKKNKDLSRKPVSKSILKELTGGKAEILEEGTAAVTAACESLIGLKKDDFLRTVVLPQGKFSEFLMLTGKERNEMLERLFHLEKYGESLAIRIAAEKKRLSLELEHLAGRLTGYEGFSEEGLKEKEEAFQKGQKEREQIEKQLAAAIRAEEERKRLRMLRQEKEQYERELLEWKGSESQAEEWEKAILLAEEAAAAAPALFQQAKKQEQEKEAAALEREAEIAFRQAVKEEEKARERADETAGREKTLVTLQEKKIRLESVIPKLDEIERWKARLKEAEKENASLKAREKSAEQEKQKTEDRLKLLEKELQAAKKEQEENLISPSYRRSVQEGAALEKETEAAAEERKKAEKELADKKKETEEAREILDQAKKRLAQAIETEREENRTLLLEAEAKLAQSLQEKDKMNRRIKALDQKVWEVRKREREETAARLRKTLRQGEPCPVCGSIHFCLEDLEPGFFDDRAKSSEIEQPLEQIEEERDQTRIQAAALEGQITSGQSRIRELKERQSRLDKGSQGFLDGQAGEEVHRAETALQLGKERERAASERLEKTDCSYREKAEKLLEKRKKEGIGDFQKAEAEIAEKDNLTESLKEKIEKIEESRGAEKEKREKSAEILAKIQEEQIRLEARSGEMKASLENRVLEVLNMWGNLKDPEKELRETEQEIARIQEDSRKAQEDLSSRKDIRYQAERDAQAAAVRASHASQDAQEAGREVKRVLSSCPALKKEMELSSLTAEKAAERFLKTEGELASLRQRAQSYREEGKRLENLIAERKRQLKGQCAGEEEWKQAAAERERAEGLLEKKRTEQTLLSDKIAEETQKLQEKRQLEEEQASKDHRKALVDQLEKLVKGKRFVEYVARERLSYISREASALLRRLTYGNYQLECSPEGRFMVIDHKNGGARRAVNTLSGGEVFLTSLALALALSNQIQLTNQAPLELFFLDEGFGTLDDSLLDTVMDALENLRSLNRRAIGLITHVEKIQEQVPVKLVVKPGETGGHGSEVELVYT